MLKIIHKLTFYTAIIFLLYSHAILGNVKIYVDHDSIRIGITPVMLDDKVTFINNWRYYLEKKLHKNIIFEQRNSYQDMVDLLLAGKIDFAWLCGYPYVQHKNQMKLVTVPLYKGEPYYQSYLIVNAKDQKTKNILDLKDEIFVYSDPNSNSGYLSPQYELLSHAINPNDFFKETFFTFSHSDVIEAVSDGLANGGAVDGYIWETISNMSPQKTSRTRVAWKSPKYGFPPIVSLKIIKKKLFVQFRDALIGMKQDAEGQALLKRLNIDTFSIQSEDIYYGIEKNMNFRQDALRKNVQ